MARFGVIVTAGIALIAGVPGNLVGQRPSLHELARCADCPITFELTGRLDGRVRPEVQMPASLVRLADGSFVLSPGNNDPSLYVIGRDNQLLHVIGRRGSGPGEFQNPWRLIVGPNDSLHVFDTELKRRSVFTPEFEFVRSEPLPAAHPRDVRLLADGGFLYGAPIPSRDLSGIPVHHYDAEGAHIRSFGTRDRTVRPDQPFRHLRVLGPVRNGRLWLAHRGQYTLERWTVDGEQIATVDVESDYFDGTFTNWDSGVPRTNLRRIYEDDAGLIWVWIAVPAEDWASKTQRTWWEAQQRYLYTATHDVWTTQLEVIDPRSGQVLARQSFAEPQWILMENGEMVVYREDETGFPIIETWKVRLNQQGGRK